MWVDFKKFLNGIIDQIIIGLNVTISVIYSTKQNSEPDNNKIPASQRIGSKEQNICRLHKLMLELCRHSDRRVVPNYALFSSFDNDAKPAVNKYI